MVQIQLSDEELAAVRDVVIHTDRAQHLRRAQAILWLCQGESVQEVAARLCVSRATIYNWVTRFEARADLDVLDRLADAARSGRPATALGIIDPIIADLVDSDPRERGYRQTVWTADLFVHYLKREHGIEVSVDSVRDAIGRLGIVWKRPRHDLSLKPKTWRQAKGGSNVASEAESGPSS
jgi:transposase